MEKKAFKVYEAPKTETVEMEVQSIICASGKPDSPWNPGDSDDI